MSYDEAIRKQVEGLYSIAKGARQKGNDPKPTPEIYRAKDVSGRVEGLVGPVGVAETLRKLKKAHKDDSEVALLIADEILSGKFGVSGTAAVQQAIRTALAYITQGVVAAPIEGIADIRIEKNPDGTNYIALYFAGPIRSAGGTAQAMAVLVADHVRSKAGIGAYKPYEDEIGRYYEEMNLYERFVRLQYTPTEAQVRTVVENCPVCITGEPTEQIEVSNYRNLPRISTNRLRGGACLVIAEGIIQKAPKLQKRLEKLKHFGLEWGWLGGVIRREAEQKLPTPKFLNEVPAGRPVFGEAAKAGGFRLRYGRARTSGFAATAVHPATMEIVNSYIATGTQLRVERPGKATVVSPCSMIEGPIVRLKNGEVLQIESPEDARRLRKDVEKILSLGDLLIAYGDFIQNNHPLLPAGYCEEWWAQESKDPRLAEYRQPPYPSPPADLALSAAKREPLHPKYTFCWSDLTFEELLALHKFVVGAEGSTLQGEAKPLLEKLGVFHKGKTKLSVDPAHWTVLKAILSAGHEPEGEDTLSAIQDLSGLIIKDKSPTYIGARMGRPEKAAPREMKPPPNVIFPTGMMQGRIRSLEKAIGSEQKVYVDLARFECKHCGPSPYRICLKCGGETKLLNTCPRCGATGADFCKKCNVPMQPTLRREIDLSSYLENAADAVGEKPGDVKGVLGMTSAQKIPEPLEKGVLRAKHNLHVFKDGTVRYDSTNMPLTHFRPREICTSVSRLRKIGYDKDIHGRPLKSADQLLQLKPQDVLLSTYGGASAADFFVRDAQFVDDMLVKYYKVKAFYNVKAKEDLVGHLVLGLAPHTSAAVVGRIIGFTANRVGMAHPYWHAAKRRDADGDEDAMLLMLDALLDFSGAYLPASRGGTMDAPLVLIEVINPHEVDDEAYDIDIVDRYPLLFYEAAQRGEHPSKVADKILRVGDVLEKDVVWQFTHDTEDFNRGPRCNRYTTGAMLDKLSDQLELARKIRAVDENLVASRILSSHFIPDIKGNLRKFSKQQFRCVKCNSKYRRVPLSGKCRRCGGTLLLTVFKNSVTKYLDVSKKLARKYKVSDYIQQQLRLLDWQIEESLGKDAEKQTTLEGF